jgi:hypothetical protein
MTDETKDVLKKAAEYVAETEPKLEAYAEKQASFNLQAERSAAVLVNRGILLENKRDEFVTKCAADPRFALQFMEKLAAAVGTADLGEPSEIKVAEDGGADPFEKEFFPERFQHQTGMIN